MTCTIVILAVLVKLPIANGLLILGAYRSHLLGGLEASFPLTKTFDVLVLTYMLHLKSLFIN